jgi:hypothetical protein
MCLLRCAVLSPTTTPDHEADATTPRHDQAIEANGLAVKDTRMACCTWRLHMYKVHKEAQLNLSLEFDMFIYTYIYIYRNRTCPYIRSFPCVLACKPLGITLQWPAHGTHSRPTMGSRTAPTVIQAPVVKATPRPHFGRAHMGNKHLGAPVAQR